MVYQGFFELKYGGMPINYGFNGKKDIMKEDAKVVASVRFYHFGTIDTENPISMQNYKQAKELYKDTLIKEYIFKDKLEMSRVWKQKIITLYEVFEANKAKSKKAEKTDRTDLLDVLATVEPIETPLMKAIKK